ncbi:SMP-30/gluconolactonase/LRE family protein [Roseobacter sinensis]|uniref:SMP-30/gluconolactonase/LRE family protein n=1 Tax=Roseobacter sinensis TaxID=2931391 RepID=A0ABT3BFC4_9RHOB|nr:SMP-30/gluconolactonase/LRE family protein [Roseobacter sp. WL0113]MCV3272296.1 SMP-30/gluconolactonase/LRE family protein [Roseobacter sp. WL0113]
MSDAVPVGRYRAVLGESTLWLPERKCIAWVDIEGRATILTDVETGEEQINKLPDRPTALADLGSGLLVARDCGIVGPDGTILAANPQRPPGRFNDGTAGIGGQFWISTIGPEGGRLHRLGRDGQAWHLRRDLVTGLGTPNGLALSPDGQWLYLSDSRAERQGIWRFAHDPRTGDITDRQPFFETAGHTGRPDGATTDTAGNYWFAGMDAGEVVCLSPSGDILRRVPLPVSKPTRPALASGRLFVTSIRMPDEPLSGRLLAVTL